MTKVKTNTITPQGEAIHLKEDAHSRLQQFMEEERKMVKGRFRCYETPGSRTRIQVRKYKDLPMFDKTMIDNEVYEVPLYVARHLNGVDVTAQHINGKINSCSYPVHGFTFQGNNFPQSVEGSGPNGEAGVPVPLIGVAKRVRRYGFESLEFGELV